MKSLLLTTFAILIYCNTGFAQQRQLWVTTTIGGNEGWRGGIFMADSTGTNFQSVYNCDTSGSQILGGLVMAANGLLYGVTETGGYNDSCVICTYDPLTGDFTNIYDLVLEPDSGYGNSSGLTVASDGKLYGLAPSGGVHSGGVLYMIDPYDNSYHIKHHFDEASGAYPFGGLTQLSNGKLYGMTGGGGNFSGGVIFSFDLSNSSYSVLHHFETATGVAPQYTNLIQATDGKLYGMTSYGGLNSQGVIFSLNLTGNVYTKLHDFDYALGAVPWGSLTQATDGKLYGLTNGGGSDNGGVIFSFNLLSSTYNALFHFTDTLGMNPGRSLTQTSSGKLFGTARQGGTFSSGVIFNFDITTNTYTKVYDFDGVTGGEPDCEVYESTSQITSAFTTVTHTSAKFTLFPNPATNTVTVDIDETLIGRTATITDITGRTMEAAELATGNLQLATENFGSGIYFVTVTDKEGRSATKKLLVNK